MPGSGISARRSKSIVMITAVAVSGLTIVAWSQLWFTLSVVDDEPGSTAIEVTGDVAAGGLAGLGLAQLALVGALSIAGPVFRVILGVIEVLIGATVVLSAGVAVADPVSASTAAITEATGISGPDSVGALVESAVPAFWPYAALVLGVSSIVLGAIIVTTSGRWPGSSRYRAVRLVPADDPVAAVSTPAVEGAGGRADAQAPTDAVADWDALSDGSDPTSR